MSAWVALTMEITQPAARTRALRLGTVPVACPMEPVLPPLLWIASNWAAIIKVTVRPAPLFSASRLAPEPAVYPGCLASNCPRPTALPRAERTTVTAPLVLRTPAARYRLVLAACRLQLVDVSTASRKRNVSTKVGSIRVTVLYVRP